MATSTWTYRGHAWTDASAFAPAAPGIADLALFTGIADVAVAGNATIGELLVTGGAPTVFTGLVQMDLRLSLLVDGGGNASFAQGGSFSGGEVVVGQTGTGTLQIGKSSYYLGDLSGTAVIGQAPGSFGTVVLAGGLWIVGAFMRVGDNGTGDLTVSGGGFLSVGDRPFGSANLRSDLIVGRHASGAGSVTVTGARSVLGVVGTAHVGEAGSGLLFVSNGGLFDAGTLDLGATGHVSLGDATIGANVATLAAGSTVSGNGRLNLSAVDNEGTITAEGTLDIVGNVSGGGTLAIAAGSTLALSQAVLGLQTVAFAGPQATLVAEGSVTGVITGFGATDSLIVSGATALSYATASEVLSVTLGTGGGTEQFQFAGLAAGAAFHLVHPGSITKIELVSTHA